jgi:BioD-like phosphotransacetylase family protein
MKGEIMKTFIIASLSAGSGKTSIIVGLADTLGKRTGYIKPFGDRFVYSKKRLWDYDAALMTELYSLKEPPEEMSLGFDHSKLRYMHTRESITEKVIEMADKIRQDKEILFVEGGQTLSYGLSVHLDPISLAKYLKGELIIVVSGDDDSILDDVMFIKQNIALSDVCLGGIIINKVHHPEDFKETVLPEIVKTGVKVLGIIPFENELTFYSLRYLADKLFAKVLTAENQLERKVKNILIGAMSGNTALQKPIFKKEDTLIITAGDRTDMILAALESNAAGVILTNNILPPSNIIAKAEQSKTPLLLVSPDTYRIGLQIEKIDPLLTKDDDVKRKAIKAHVQKGITLNILNS